MPAIAQPQRQLQVQPQTMQTQGGQLASPMQPQMSNPLGGRGLQGSLNRQIPQMQSARTNYMAQYQANQMAPDAGGVVAGPSQQPQIPQGPSLEQIQAEMARRNVGAQLNANPANSALSGYMMGQ